MKGRWRLPTLGRTGRTVRNLLLCLVLLVLLWEEFAFPMPTLEMNFRRMEHYYLLPQGELVYRDGERFVDRGEGQAVVGWISSRSRPTTHITGCELWVCPLGEGPSPVSLSDREVLFLQVPVQAREAELELHSGQGTMVAWGRQEDGLVLFRLEDSVEANCTSPSAHWGVEGWPYTLRLYGETGAVILEREGEVPLCYHRSYLSLDDDDCYGRQRGN